MGGELKTFTVCLLATFGVVVMACEAAHTTAPPLHAPALSATQVIPVDTATDGSGDVPPDSTAVPGEPHDCQDAIGDETRLDPSDGQAAEGDANTPPCSGWVIQ